MAGAVHNSMVETQTKVDMDVRLTRCVSDDKGHSEVDPMVRGSHQKRRYPHGPTVGRIGQQSEAHEFDPH